MNRKLQKNKSNPTAQQRKTLAESKTAPSSGGQSHKAKFDRLLDDAVLGVKKK